MLRLCAAPRKRKNHVHRLHTSRKQALAVIWGASDLGGVPLIPMQPCPWSGSAKVSFCQLVIFTPPPGFLVPWAQDALGSCSAPNKSWEITTMFTQRSSK